MEKITWKTPHKMEICTGHKTFDKQTNIISTGNIIANTMYGQFVRSRYRLECNGRTNPEGHLQEFDLNGFSSFLANDSHDTNKIIKTIKRLADENNGVIVYVIFTRYFGYYSIIGYIITDVKYKLLHRTWYSVKGQHVINECCKYITE